MDFELNEEQKLIRDSARDFLKTECPKSVVRELEESKSGYSPVLWKKMAELGWMGITVPEEYGGAGLSWLDQAVLFEEFGRAAMPGPMFSTAIGAQILVEGGTDGQKETYLSKVTSGDLILTLAWEELEVVNNPAFVSTRVVPAGGGYEINGTKLFVPYAQVADLLLVVARTEGKPGDENGITVFLVNPKTTGIHLTPVKTIAADKQFRVDFEKVQVSSHDVVGEANKGLLLVESVLEKAAALQCVEMVGGAQQELEMTTEYTKTRFQFDRAIGTFQAVQHRLADMYIDANGARWVAYQAVWRLTEGLPAARELAIAKIIANKACQRVAFSAQQLHGGIGVDLDFDLHFYYRRAKAFELKFGTTLQHLELLGSQI